MKKKAIIKLIIYSVTAIVLTAVMTVGILFDFGAFRYVTSNIIKYEANEEAGFSPADSDTLTFTDINSLDIEWTTGNVIIKKGSGNAVTVSESADFDMNDNQKMRISSSGDTLRIKFSKRIRFWGTGTYNLKPKTLTVTLPEKLYDSVSVDTVSADVEITDLNTDELDIDTVSGDITLSGIKTSTLDCDSVSGDLDAEDVSAAEVDYESVSGEMDFDGIITRSGSFDAVSGEMTLRLPPVGFYYDVDTETFSGKTTLNGNDNINKGSNNGSDVVYISLTSLSGDITFNSNIGTVFYEEDISSLSEILQEMFPDISIDFD